MNQQQIDRVCEVTTITRNVASTVRDVVLTAIVSYGVLILLRQLME